MTQMPTQINMANTIIPSILQALKVAENLLDKAEAHAKAKNIKEETILGLRLIADMFPFVKQIQIVTDNVKGAAARLSGSEMPAFADNETTIAELKARIAKTREFVLSVDSEAIIGTETKEIVLKFGELVFPFVGYSYGFHYLLPNLNFHLSMAYAILRSNGVVLGKTDYLVQ